MSKRKGSKARVRGFRKGPEKLSDEERISKLELEKSNLIQQLHKRQVEAQEAAKLAKNEEVKIKEFRERHAKVRADHADMYAILPRTFLHGETAFKIHLTAIFNDRKKLKNELEQATAELQKWTKANNELEKQIENEIQLGDTRIAAVHFRYPDVFETVIKEFIENSKKSLVEEYAQKADELHHKLKAELLHKVPLLPPSKY